MDAETYLYNLSDKKLRSLYTSDPAITPAIWGKYVVLNTYSSKSPEIKNIVLYNLNTGSYKQLTDATPSNMLEYWGPTVAHGIITWNVNLPGYEPETFIVASGEKRQLGVVGEQTKVCGSWLAWRHPEEGLGMFILGLNNFFPVLDLTGLDLEKALTKPPLSLDIPINKSELARLTPPEVVATYLQAEKESRYDVISILLSDEPGLAGKQEYLADIKRNREKVISFTVSTDYLVEGDTAYVGVLQIKTRQPNQKVIVKDKPINIHLTLEEGIWKVTQVAGQ